MPVIDAKKEIDAYYGHLKDVEHFIGVILFRSPDTRIAMARLVFDEDGEAPEWPKELVYRHAIDLGSRVSMFIICEPRQFMKPLVATEWDDAYQVFIEAAERHGVFLVEIITPKHRYGASIVNSKITETVTQDITPEQYTEFRNAYREPERVQS